MRDFIRMVRLKKWWQTKNLCRVVTIKNVIIHIGTDLIILYLFNYNGTTSCPLTYSQIGYGVYADDVTAIKLVTKDFSTYSFQQDKSSLRKSKMKILFKNAFH